MGGDDRCNRDLIELVRVKQSRLQRLRTVSPAHWILEIDALIASIALQKACTIDVADASCSDWAYLDGFPCYSCNPIEAT